MSKGKMVSKIMSWDKQIPEDDILEMEDYLAKLCLPCDRGTNSCENYARDWDSRREVYLSRGILVF